MSLEAIAFRKASGREALAAEGPGEDVAAQFDTLVHAVHDVALGVDEKSVPKPIRVTISLKYLVVARVGPGPDEAVTDVVIGGGWSRPGDPTV